MSLDSNFYDETKYCPKCKDYVLYLMSLDANYCLDCGTKVRLFSNVDKRAFKKALKLGKKQIDKRVS
jgi:hypothetical protein